jgi:hypothetical protein
VDMVSVHMGSLELESKGGDGEDELDDVEDELVEEDSPKPKAKGKGRVKKGAKVQKSTMTSLLIMKVQQGKVSSYQTAE